MTAICRTVVIVPAEIGRKLAENSTIENYGLKATTYHCLLYDNCSANCCTQTTCKAL
jgi:hypothetical protein